MAIWLIAILLVGGMILATDPRGAAAAPASTAANTDVAPMPADASYPYIDHVRLNTDLDGIEIALTDDGLAYAGTCDGAAELAAEVVLLYARVPDTPDSIAWAEEAMTREIYGHGRAAAGDIPLPDAEARANPVDIVFAHYTDPTLIVNDFDAWTYQRAYATLYRLDCEN